MDIKKLMFLKATQKKTDDSAYHHENVKKLTVIGNPYAWEPVKSVNKQNLITIPPVHDTSHGVEFESHDNIVTFNGTGTETTEFIVAEFAVDIPAGNYRMFMDAYLGDSEFTGRNMFADFFYEGATSYSVRTIVYSVKSSWVYGDFTLAEKAVKIRIWFGTKTEKFDDFRIWYGVYDKSFSWSKTTEKTLTNGETYDVTYDTTQTMVDTLWHKSSVKE